MPSNVRPFRPKGSSAEHRDRLLAALLYLLLGWLLQGAATGDGGLLIFIALAILYWVFIHRGHLRVSYFFRFHFLQATLMFLLLYFALFLSVQILQLAAHAARIVHLSVISEPVTLLTGIIVLAGRYIMLGAGISQAIFALLGKTPRLPVVTANVHYWV